MFSSIPFESFDKCNRDILFLVDFFGGHHSQRRRVQKEMRKKEFNMLFALWHSHV